jgi:hypothetical protein
MEMLSTSFNILSKKFRVIIGSNEHDTIGFDALKKMNTASIFQTQQDQEIIVFNGFLPREGYDLANGLC